MLKDKYSQIGIVGTGMIGTSLAVLTTAHGVETLVFAIDETQRDIGKKSYETFLSDLTQKSLLNASQADKARALLKYTLAYEDFNDCPFVFEAVVENAEVKSGVYKAIEANCPKIKAIASVSSAIEVDNLAKAMEVYKNKLVVAHPFYPPHMIPYFEISVGKETDKEAVSYTKTLLEDLDRKPIVLKKSAPGFVGNRLQFALWREALNIVSSGIANPEDVDTCLKYSFCPRYTSAGIFESFDNGGLDLNINVCSTIFPTLSNADKAPEILKGKIDAGKLGVKTGEGFYKWDDEKKAEVNRRLSLPFDAFFKTNL